MNYEDRKRAFANKLAHYSRCEPKAFCQIDAFNTAPDYVMRPDADGDAIMGGSTIELMHGADVRVLIPLGADPKVARRQLKKIASWLKSNPGMLKAPEEDQEDDLPF